MLSHVALLIIIVTLLQINQKFGVTLYCTLINFYCTVDSITFQLTIVFPPT